MAQEQSEDETNTAANISEDAATAELNAVLETGRDPSFTALVPLSHGAQGGEGGPLHPLEHPPP